MPTPKPKKKRAPKKSKKAGAAKSRGLEATKLTGGTVPKAVESLAAQVAKDGGEVLATYKDPLGGKWQLLASLPIECVEPTPYQRDISDTHVARLGDAIDKLDRFLDPIIAVPADAGMYWSPNGFHRLRAMTQLGARAITALVVPEPDVAHRILALNTEKAHNLKEKSIEVSRLAQALAEMDPGSTEKSHTEIFEEAGFITLGLCYQENGRFSGGAYNPILKRIDLFLTDKLPAALKERQRRAALLLELNEDVNAAVAKLKAKGLESPYLKAFVVSRVNHLRWVKEKHPDFDDTMAQIMKAAKRFNTENVRADQVAKSGGAPSSEE